MRFDLVTALSGPNEESRLEKNGSLMLSVPDLVRMQGQLTDVVNKLVEDGVLQQDKKEPNTSK